MKQQIDNLIANILLDEGEVYLPEVGTLILRRRTAKLLSKKELQRPCRELQLTKEQRGESLTAYISHITGVSSERASDIYAEWLAQSLFNNILTINDLCIINGNSITINQTFENMANPKGRGTIKINPLTNYFIYIVAGLCMGIALGIAGYVLYANGTLDSLFAKQKVAPASSAFKAVEEQPAQPAQQPTEQVADTVTEPIAEKPTIAPMQKGSSYAVWGVYNELKNAENAVSWLSTRIPEIEGVNIYDYDGRYMVALCEVASRSECGRKVSAWKAQHKSCKSVWVYTRE